MRKSVYEFLMMGGRHLDGAVHYENAPEVGEGIRQAMAAGIPREEIFYVTKIPAELFGFQSVMQIMDSLLKTTDIGYFDLVLLHHPTSPRLEELGRCNTPWRCRQESWLALERFRDKGLVRHLGVSNMSPERMQSLIDLGASPVEVLQLEYSPWVPVFTHETVEWCHARGIAITAYASLGSPHVRGQRDAGIVTEGPIMERLKGMADSYGKTWTQVLLRWAVQHNVSVIPGTGNPAHMAENLDLFDWSLSAEDMAYLDATPGGSRGLVFTFALNEEYLMGNRDHVHYP